MHLKKETHFLNQGVGDDTMVGVGSAGPGRSRTGLKACTRRPAAAGWHCRRQRIVAMFSLQTGSPSPPDDVTDGRVRPSRSWTSEK